MQLSLWQPECAWKLKVCQEIAGGGIFPKTQYFAICGILELALGRSCELRERCSGKGLRLLAFQVCDFDVSSRREGDERHLAAALAVAYILRRHAALAGADAKPRVDSAYASIALVVALCRSPADAIRIKDIVRAAPLVDHLLAVDV